MDLSGYENNNMGYQDKIQWSRDLAERVTKDFKPYAVLVGYTSGGDSNVALKLATMFFKVDAAFTCDTTISAIETIRNCHDVVRNHYELPWICQAPRYNGISNNHDTYFEVVKRHGFPGKTTTAHRWMYKWLKDHTIQNIVAQFRKRRHNRPVVIISGARRHESVRRMGTSEDITVYRNNIWVNICNDWTDQDTYEFSRDYDLDRFRSPISKAIGISGECFCGCFAQKNELFEVKAASPSTYEKIQWITKWLRENTNMLWDWESGPPTKREIAKSKRDAGQIKLFSPQMLFCSTCMNNTEVVDEVIQ